MNPLSARHLAFALLFAALIPGCGGDPPADTGTTGPIGDPSTDTSGTTGTTADPPAPEGESASTTDPGATSTSDPGTSSSGDDSTGSGGDGGEPVVLGNIKSCPVSGEAAPTLPEEAGQLAATVLTPDTYPFEVSSVLYATVHNLGRDCVSTFAHRVEVSVIDGDAPLSKPSVAASTFVSFAIEESLEELPLRVIEPELDPPIVLQEGQSLVVAVSLEADVDAGLRLCLDTCVGDPTLGVDFWSQAAAEPYDWIGLDWPANFKLFAVGRAL